MSSPDATPLWLRGANAGTSTRSPFVICAAWNGEDRDFIYHMKEVDGDAIVRTFGSIIGEHEIPLAKQEGERRLLSLNTADQILEGYYS